MKRLTQVHLADQRNQEAAKQYNARYDNHLYQLATLDKSVNYANALIDEALALCGSPHYKISNRRWSQAAMTFLKLFI